MREKPLQTNKTMRFLNVISAGVISGIFVLSATAEDKVQIDGAEVGKWTMDYEAAVELAAKEKLPMMMNFTGSDWCGWCKLMDKGVFAQDEWKKFAAKNVLLVTLDFHKDKNIVPDKYVSRNKELQKQFGVRGFPTYVVLDSDGKSKLGQLGAGRDKTPASFIDEFKGVIRMSASGIEAFIKANPDKADAYKAAIKEGKDAKEDLANWISTKPERNEENNKKFAAFQERIKAAAGKLKDF